MLFRDFFDDKIGPCNFDFVKVDPAKSKLYIAVRFESKENARECMNRQASSNFSVTLCFLVTKMVNCSATTLKSLGFEIFVDTSPIAKRKVGLFF